MNRIIVSVSIAELFSFLMIYRPNEVIISPNKSTEMDSQNSNDEMAENLWGTTSAPGLTLFPLSPVRSISETVVSVAARIESTGSLFVESWQNESIGKNTNKYNRHNFMKRILMIQRDSLKL